MEKEQKASLIGDYQVHPKDSGSAEVQIALLTEHIRGLAGHFQAHSRDHHSRRGLLMMVGRRRRLLKYLARTSPQRHRALLARLGLNR